MFQKDGELSSCGRKLVGWFASLYALLLVYLCFLPQTTYPQYKTFSTPGIIQLGPFYILPIPFNSLVNAPALDSLSDWLLVLLQNVANIFLLYPLVLAFVFLFQDWRNYRTVAYKSFLISLFIECQQLVVDWLFDAGRVFEVDDLWTNTLGGMLAYATYRMWKKHQVTSF